MRLSRQTDHVTDFHLFRIKGTAETFARSLRSQKQRRQILWQSIRRKKTDWQNSYFLSRMMENRRKKSDESGSIRNGWTIHIQKKYSIDRISLRRPLTIGKQLTGFISLSRVWEHIDVILSSSSEYKATDVTWDAITDLIGLLLSQGLPMLSIGGSRIVCRLWLDLITTTLVSLTRLLLLLLSESSSKDQLHWQAIRRDTGSRTGTLKMKSKPFPEPSTHMYSDLVPRFRVFAQHLSLICTF